MVLLTLFAGDGGYNPQLQRVGEGETFLHGYLTIHVIINLPHHTQGCISCGICSYPELTKDHVLTSAYVHIFRTIMRNAVNKSV